MAARDSDDDIRKYLPDMSAILREADPARAREKLAKAQENSDLDGAMPRARVPSTSVAVPPVSPAAVALPSSPVAPPGVKRTVRRAERAPLSPWAKGTVAVIAVVGPVTLLWALFVRPNGRERVDPARVVASAGPGASAAPTISATWSPIVTAPVPAPTIAPEVDAGATVAPVVQPGGSVTKPKSHPGTKDDPYDAAPPMPAKTTEVVVSPPPTVVAPPPIAPVVSSAPVAPPPSATATVKPIF